MVVAILLVSMLFGGTGVVAALVAGKSLLTALGLYIAIGMLSALLISLATAIASLFPTSDRPEESRPGL